MIEEFGDGFPCRGFGDYRCRSRERGSVAALRRVVDRRSGRAYAIATQSQTVDFQLYSGKWR